MSISFRPSEPGDDADLRAILRRTPMAGCFRLAFEREPSYFAGGADETTLVACAPDGRPVGMFSRAVQRVFLDGRPRRLGYLGQLRLLPEWRGRSRCIPLGFRLARDLLGDSSVDVPFFLTSILDDNRPARHVLMSGRAGLPIYTPLRRMVTLTMAPHRCRPGRDGFAVRPASTAEMKDLLDDQGRRFDLHSSWDEAALDGLAAKLVVERDGRTVACGAVWDLRRFRQIRLTGMPRWLAAIRPPANLALGLGGLPRIPAVGCCLDLAFLSHLVLLPGEEDALPALLDGLRAAAHGMGLAAISMGLPEGHPWLPGLRKVRALRSFSTLYAVHWNTQSEIDRLVQAPLHPELACL